MSGHQYVEFSTKGAGVTQNSGGSAVRWEQGTCNASFRDEASKLRNLKPEKNGKKVESLHFVAAADAASQFLLSLTSLVLKHFDLSSRFKVEAFLFLFAPAAFLLLLLKTAYSALSLNANYPLAQRRFRSFFSFSVLVFTERFLVIG